MTDVSLLTLASSALAAVAVLGWMSPRSTRRLPDTLRLQREGADDVAAPLLAPPWERTRRPTGWGGVLVGRLDAPPLARRIMIAGLASLAMTAALVTLAGSFPLWAAALLAPIGTVSGAVGLGLLEPAATRVRNRSCVRDAPQALELLAACLAAGLPPRNATAAVVGVFDGPVAEDLGFVSRAVDVGLSDVVAWRSLRRHPQLGEAAVDLARAVESGTRMVETLTYYAGEARLRRAAAAESAAKSVAVRCVLPMMLCFIPSFILLGVVPATVSAFLAAVPKVF